jgi:hypothetical protein
MAWAAKRTPSYEGTRTPSPTAPPLTLTKIVWAEVDVAAAARTSEVDSFIVMFDVAWNDGLKLCLIFQRRRCLSTYKQSLHSNIHPSNPDPRHTNIVHFQPCPLRLTGCVQAQALHPR